MITSFTTGHSHILACLVPSPQLFSSNEQDCGAARVTRGRLAFRQAAQPKWRESDHGRSQTTCGGNHK